MNSLWKIDSTNKNTYTLFCQGVLASQIQLASYCGKEGFVTTTKEVVTKVGKKINIIYQPFIGRELQEVLLSSSKQTTSFSFFLFLKFLWSPIFYLLKWISFYKNKKTYKIIPSTTEEEQKETVQSHSIDWRELNLGQKGNRNEIKEKYYSLFKERKVDKIVLFGISRGAATIFASCCSSSNSYNYVDSFAQVKLVILEGCFDSVENVIAKRFPFLFSFLASKALELLTQYSKKEDQESSPLALVNFFPRRIPVAFITSEIDHVVPLTNTLNLVNALKNTGHEHVHLLVLKHSTHSTYASFHKEDQIRYQSFIHGLYKKYGLPYIEEYIFVE